MRSRHVLTVDEQIRGLRAAIASPRTPPKLRAALDERLKALQQKVEAEEKRRVNKKTRRRPGLLDLLGL